MSTPVTRRRENTRARLLDAAAEVFAEVGLDGASVEAICDRAGFTRGAFYSNFETKDELFLTLAAAVAEDRLSAVRARIDEITASGELRPGADPLELARQVVDFGRSDRLTVLLMSEIRIRALRDDAFGAAYLAQQRDIVGGIEQIIRGIVDTGLVRLRVDVEPAAVLLMAAWDSAMVDCVIERRSDEEAHRAAGERLGSVVDVIVDRGAESAPTA